MPQGTETEAEQRSGMDRRTLIKAAGAAGVVAWSAPVIYGSLASPAAAQQSSCAGITRVGNASAVSAGENGQVSVTLPASVDEDLILIAVVAETNNAAITWPTGFATVPGANITNTDGTRDHQMAIGWKVRSGAQASPVTVTVAGGNGVDDILATAVVYRCAKIGNLFDPVNPATSTPANDDNPNAPDVTTSFNNSMVLSFASIDEIGGVTLQTARGFSAVFSGTAYDDNDLSMGMAQLVKTPAGSTDAPQWQAGGARDWVMITMGLRLATT